MKDERGDGHGISESAALDIEAEYKRDIHKCIKKPI
jgi:hypothetical protein